jgi:hypothetical protein
MDSFHSIVMHRTTLFKRTSMLYPWSTYGQQIVITIFSTLVHEQYIIIVPYPILTYVQEDGYYNY